MARRSDISIDGKLVKELELDLSRAPGRLQRASREALRTRVGPVLAQAMRQDAAGHKGNWFGIPGTEFDTPMEEHVSHEMVGPQTVEAGIEDKGAGRLARIIVMGSVNNAPVYDYMSGPRRVMPTIERILGNAAEDSVLGAEK